MTEENSFDLLRRIAEKTIAFDITPTKPSSDSKQSDDAEWKIVKECDIRDSYKDFVEYEPTTEELADICELVHKDRDYDKWFKNYTYRKSGDVILCTSPQHTWMSLCGREYAVNLKEKKMWRTRMS
jgi:hypothetical protein